MPNGDDKNWLRICSAVDGFRARHGQWPTEVHLPPAYFENVVGHVLSPAGFAVVSNMFAIVSDDDLSKRIAIIAVHEDAEFRYGEEEKADQTPEPLTSDFFGPAVLREGLDSGLESVTLHNAQGDLVWTGKGIQKARNPVAADQKGDLMQVVEFLSQPGNAHSEQGNPVVKCNALYKAEANFNCLLTPPQAIALARNLLQKAQLILEEKLDDAAVHVWNKGKVSEKLYCGLKKARKQPRSKGGKKAKPIDSKGQA